MRLFRYLSEQELLHLLANEIEDVGKVYYEKNKKERENSHHYKKDTKYLHFYFDKAETQRICNLGYHLNEVCYVCEFEIPFYIIFPHIGIGRYENSGYITPYETVYEVALPTNKMKAKYLVGYQRDKNTEKFSDEYELNF